MLLWVLMGVGVGAVTGLTPGLHVNALVLILSAAEVDPEGGAVMLVSAAVTHTFLDFIPTTFLGVPDEGTALSIFPSHRMVMEGYGLKAVRLSLYGSLLSSLALCSVILPASGLAYALTSSQHYGRAVVAVLLSMLALLVAVDARISAKRGAVALASVALSGALGLVVLSSPLSVSGALSGASPLFPMLTGLYAVPALLMARSVRIPPQKDGPHVMMRTSGVAKGLLAGGLVSLFPGVSSGVAAAACSVVKGDDEEYITSLGGANTANAVLTSFAVLVTGRPRSGVGAYINSLHPTGTMYPLPEMAVWILISLVISSLVAGLITMPMAGLFARAVSGLSYRRLSRFILAALLALTFVFGGVTGLIVLGAATVVGSIPPRLGCSRATLMGCIIIPALIAYL
jgi:putative membrane protein